MRNLERRQALLEAIVRKAHPTLSLETSRLEQFVASATDDGAPAARTGDSEDQTPSSIVAVNGVGRLVLEGAGVTHYIGESSGWCFVDKIRQTVGMNRFDYDVVENYKHLVSSEDNFARRYTKHSACDLIPSEPVLSFLIETYFESVQRSYAIIHPLVFHRRLEELMRDRADPAFTSNKQIDTAFVSVLLMALALGREFCEILDPSTLPFDKHDPTVCSSGEKFYEAARSLMLEVISTRNLCSIQAMALMGIFAQSTRERDMAYTCVGIAQSLAIAAGLHRRAALEQTSSNALEQPVVELRNRLWWSLQCLDRFVCLSLGRPAAIASSNFDTPRPTDVPVLRRLESPLLYLQSMIKISDICELISTTMYQLPLRKGGENVTNDLFLHADVIVSMLEEFEQDYMPQLALDSIPERSFRFRSNCYVQLHYHQAAILATRPFLLEYVVRMFGGSSGGSPELAKYGAQLHEFSQVCLKSARAQAELLHALRLQGLVSLFSFYDYYFCCASLFVLYLNEIMTPGDAVNTNAIKKGHVVMEYLSHGLDSARTSLEMLRELEAAVALCHSRSQAYADPRAKREPHRRSTSSSSTTTRTNFTVSSPSVADTQTPRPVAEAPDMINSMSPLRAAVNSTGSGIDCSKNAADSGNAGFEMLLDFVNQDMTMEAWSEFSLMPWGVRNYGAFEDGVFM